MRITKLGHCCLLIEEQGVRLLTDPGAYTPMPIEVSDIHAILITHEHPDHLHMESLKHLLEQHPGIPIITNASVGNMLTKERIVYTVVNHAQEHALHDITLLGHGTMHAPIYPSIPQVENTGYIINKRLYYPGDAFTLPPHPIEILALPVAGPWMKLAEAVDFAKAVRPKICFPVHDGMLKYMGIAHILPKKELEPLGIVFHALENGTSFEA